MNVFIWLTLIFRECWNLVDNHPICLHMEMQSMNEWMNGWMNELNHMIINVNVAVGKFLCLCLFVLISWMLNVEWWMIDSLFVCLLVCFYVGLIDWLIDWLNAWMNEFWACMSCLAWHDAYECLNVWKERNIMNWLK